ncbi:MAG: formate dehydrogenase subunit gamma [Alphaproteobacteria bacterium]
MTTAIHKAPAAAWNPDPVREVAERLKGLDGPLLPILHAINEQFGYVDERALPIIADVLNLTRAEVQGVVSFYHDFRRAPAGRHVVKVCRAEACQSMGAERLIGELEKSFGVTLGETSTDGRVTLEAVYCLGNCALSPAALIDGKLFGRLDAAKAQAQVSK